VKGIPLPSDLYPATKDMLPYVEAGKTAPALEFLSPIKGPNLPQICVQTGLGLKSPLENAQEYDKDVAKQAKQLGLAGW
jgi:raffinose/stachyose/melibiose transport system substrate-binding protein